MTDPTPTEVWPKFCPCCCAEFHADGTVTPGPIDYCVQRAINEGALPSGPVIDNALSAAWHMANVSMDPERMEHANETIRSVLEPLYRLATENEL